MRTYSDFRVKYRPEYAHTNFAWDVQRRLICHESWASVFSAHTMEECAEYICQQTKKEQVETAA